MKMKTSFVLLLILGLVTLQSCDNKTSEKIVENNEKTEISLTGTWSLYKEVIKGKQIDHSGKPTALSLTFKENNFFILFDKITDPKIVGSGVGEIQERYKGQFEKKDDKLIMNHFVNDSLVTKSVTIKRLTENELVLKDNTTKNEQYFKK